jgi:DNA-binding MarR family transcriptional regulator
VATTTQLPLPTLLSQALVAFVIEIDNEAERRLPHWTTTEDDPGARVHTPWLVSYPLWANVLRYVPPDGISVAELQDLARTGRLLLGKLRRWGYVRLRAPAGAAVKNPPQSETAVRLTSHARTGGEVWHAMAAAIEARWRHRYGVRAIDALDHASAALVDVFDIDPPDFLPPVFPTQGGRTETPVLRLDPASSRPRDLPALLSGVLDAFALDFEKESRVSLAISANTLRVLDGEGVRLRDLPKVTGVSKEANAMCAGWLERRGCAEKTPDLSAGRGQVLRLTRKGQGAHAKYRRILAETEGAWRTTYGAGRIDALCSALEPLVGDGTLASSPLAAALETRSDNWRAAVRAPETLPHHPMVLHRGAYPDGS